MHETPNRLGQLPVATLLTALLLSIPAPVAGLDDGAEVGGGREVIHYRWRLEGIGGLLARLLPGIPASGEGVLSTESAGEDRALCRFHATSPGAKDDEHWTYTVEIDLSEARTLRVIDSLSFRGKQKEKTYDLTDQEVVDVLSGLHLLSRSVPESQERTVIWSNRKTYPVVVTPHGLVRRRVDGRPMTLRYVTISGVREEGQKRWSSQAEIWFTADDPAIPVEIVYRQSMGRLHLVSVGDPVVSTPQPLGPSEDKVR